MQTHMGARHAKHNRGLRIYLCVQSERQTLTWLASAALFIGKLGPARVAALLKDNVEKPSDFETLNARGIPTARGGTWSAMQVSNVLQRGQTRRRKVAVCATLETGQARSICSRHVGTDTLHHADRYHRYHDRIR